jgi:hypothetical protein
MINNAKIYDLKNFKLPDNEIGDLKLNVFPVENKLNSIVNLPAGFKHYETAVNNIFKRIPVLEDNKLNTHYVTIDSKFFSDDGGGYLRREGLHIDGNFCVDFNFKYKTWGGTDRIPTRPTWGGLTIEEYNDLNIDDQIVFDKKHNQYFKIKKSWITPYKLSIPVGTYVSSELGGMLVVANEVGCKAWSGTFNVNVGDAGSLENYNDTFIDNKSTLLKKNNLYFLSSNTPHKTLHIKQGVRRSLIRITLNCDYPNKLILK